MVKPLLSYPHCGPSSSSGHLLFSEVDFQSSDLILPLRVRFLPNPEKGQFERNTVLV
jgi:hypothetical protein